MFKFFIREKKGRRREIAFQEGTYAVGRALDNDLVIDDEKVSSHHLHLECREGRCLLKDLNSTNGTFVNGEMVEEKELNPGDEIRIGSTLLFYLQEKPRKKEHLVEHTDATTSTTINYTLLPTRPAFLAPKVSLTQFEDLKKDHENLAIVYKVSKAIASIFDLDELLNKILELIFEVVKADRGCIMLLEEESKELVAHAVRIRSGHPERIAVSRSITNQAIKEGKSILSSDALTDERFRGKQSIVTQHIRSAMCVPLKGKEKVLGVIHVDTLQATGAFTREDLELLTAIGNQAAIAIENARLYEENLRAERLAGIGQAVASLSHYAKNILTGMKGGVSIVDMGLEGNNPHLLKEGWEVVKSSTEKISSLIMDMLNYSKERKPDYQLHNVNKIVEDICELMKEKAKENGVALKKDLDPRIGETFFDPRGIHDSILNLVSNAIEAIEEPGGEVEVTTRLLPESNQLEVVVQDNGCGIPESEIKKIFFPFYSTKGSQGTGLGLAVTEKVIREHRGEITVKSEMGKGTAFRIILPLKKAEKEE